MSEHRNPWEILINVGAGSLLPSNPNRDIEATRRGMEAIRRTAALKRQLTHNDKDRGAA